MYLSHNESLKELVTLLLFMFVTFVVSVVLDYNLCVHFHGIIGRLYSLPEYLVFTILTR